MTGYMYKDNGDVWLCGSPVVPSDNNFYLNQSVYAIKQVQLVW